MSKKLLESRVNPLALIEQVQNSATSGYLGQCFQLGLIKDVRTMCASKNLPTSVC